MPINREPKHWWRDTTTEDGKCGHLGPYLHNCMLPKYHEGDHKCVTPNLTITWRNGKPLEDTRSYLEAVTTKE